MTCLSPKPEWRPALVVELPCAHDVEVLAEWVRPDGRFDGRLCCTYPGCRMIFDDVEVAA